MSVWIRDKLYSEKLHCRYVAFPGSLGAEGAKFEVDSEQLTPL